MSNVHKQDSQTRKARSIGAGPHYSNGILHLLYLINYLITLGSRVLLKRLTGSQPVMKLPIFYGIWRLITAFTSARHLSLSRAISIQSMPPHSTSWRSILISSHLRLGLPSVSFPQVSLPKPYVHLSPPPYVLHAPLISFFTVIGEHCIEEYLPVGSGVRAAGPWSWRIEAIKAVRLYAAMRV